MATGHLDGNGIWIYGEDDPLSPFSDFENLGQSSVSTRIGALSTSVSAHEGAWTSYTPTFTNLTVGSGAMYGRYKKIGKTVFVVGGWTFGSGSSVSAAAVNITLPVATVSGIYTGNQIVGTAGLQDFGSSYQIAWLGWISTTSVVILQHASGSGVTTTTPWTWATGDRITWTLTYEAA